MEATAGQHGVQGADPGSGERATTGAAGAADERPDAATSRSDRLRAQVRRHRWFALATFAIALISWPYAGVAPGVDGDWNWVAGLSYIAKHDLRFGSEIVWTFGPLGFLNMAPYLYFGDVAIAMFVYQWLIQVLLAGTLYAALRRSFHPAIAFVVAAVIVAMLPERAIALGFMWCALALLRSERSPRDALAVAFPPAIGVLTGILLLSKLNHGVGLTALALVALVARPAARRIDALTFGGALLAVAAIGWIVTGQTLADIWPYIRYGREVISGYGAAMGYADPTNVWQFWAAAITALLATTLLVNAARDASTRRRVGLALVWLIYIGLSFKSAFVRHDSGHASLFFAAMLVALAIFPAPRTQRAFALASMAAVWLALAASFDAYDPGRSLNPVTHVKAAWNETRLLVDRDRRGGGKAIVRDAIVNHYRVPPAVLEPIEGETVSFWPHSMGGLVYAYDLDWRPLPVLEPYAAYTPALDELGADMLASDRAPERIVRYGMLPIDHRFPTFEAPLTTLQILCRYEQIAAEQPWQVLARTEDRCGEARPLSVVEAQMGEDVAVPRPRTSGNLVIARVEGAEPRGVERLRSLVLRPRERSIMLDGARWRLISATAPDGLLLRAPADVDYPAPFMMAPNPNVVSVRRDGGAPGGGLRYEFLEVPIRPFPGAAPPAPPARESARPRARRRAERARSAR